MVYQPAPHWWPLGLFLLSLLQTGCIEWPSAYSLSYLWNTRLQVGEYFCPACFAVENPKADLPERTVERPPPINASGVGADVLTQSEALPGQGNGVPGSDQVPPGHLLLLPADAEAEAPGASGENPGPGLELLAAPTRVSEAPIGQEAASGEGTLSGGPDPWPLEEGVKPTAGPPAQATAAPSAGEMHPR